MLQLTLTPNTTIDLTGYRCPNLTIAIIRAMRSLQEGQIIQIIATDLNAPSNITAWCRQSGHILLDMYDEGQQFVCFIQCHREPVLA